MPRAKEWTQEDNKWLLDMWGKKPLEEIARHLDRTKNAVIIQHHRINGVTYTQKRKYRNEWTQEEDKLLLEMWGKKTMGEIAQHFRRTKRAVLGHYYYLIREGECPKSLQGLRDKLRLSREKGKEAKRRADTLKVITLEEQQWLAANYPYVSDRFCAMRLNVPESDVAVLAEAMKLKKDPYYYN